MYWVLAQIAVGGALGAVGRYLTGVWIDRLLPTGHFPWGTLVVNSSGCLLMGVAFAFLSLQNPENAKSATPFFMIGLLGGYTTMSAFSLDTIQLISASRHGEAMIYLVATVVISLLALLVGMALVRWLFS